MQLDGQFALFPAAVECPACLMNIDNDFKQFFFHLVVWLENHADKNSTQTITSQETCKVCWYHCKLIVKYSLIYSEKYCP